MAATIQSTFYKNLYAGKYTFPEGLYSTVITAVENRNEKEIRIHPQERPTQLERLKDKFGLKGIDFERVKITGFQDCQYYDYTVIIKPKSFLSNLSMFFDFSKEKISDKNAGKIAKNLKMQEKLENLKTELEEKPNKNKKKPKKEEIEETDEIKETDDTITEEDGKLLSDDDKEVINKTPEETSELGTELKNIIEKIVRVE